MRSGLGVRVRVCMWCPRIFGDQGYIDIEFAWGECRVSSCGGDGDGDGDVMMMVMVIGGWITTFTLILTLNLNTNLTLQLFLGFKIRCILMETLCGFVSVEHVHRLVERLYS